ncbi:MAG: amino acid racemase [Spirochaetales bacterium]|nr:amino acid racemase [Spirochaetales bacterium]
MEKQKAYKTKIGILGGMGPETTVEYYNALIAHIRKQSDSLDNPEILIYSANIGELFRIVENREWDVLVEWLLQKVKILADSGASFVVISANTPHVVFDRLEKLSPVPLFSIVEAVRDHIQTCRFKKVGLLGTKSTMTTPFYFKVFEGSGIELIPPREDEIDYIQDKLVQEIERGEIVQATQKRLVEIIKRMGEEDRIEAVILGCTELPLIIKEGLTDIPCLNTTKIHIRCMIDKFLEFEAAL